MTSLEKYLRNLSDIHHSGAGVKETSYYPALEHLLNEVGATLKPKVRCIINIKNKGAGIPDGGLFTAQQFARISAEPHEGQMPERGCVEVKGTKEDVEKVAAGEQVQKYLKRYRQVLVTNLRDFLLVGLDANNQSVNLEAYRLAASEAEFWMRAANPHALAAEHEGRFAEYLKRVMLHAAPLASPEDVARFLASYARDAKARIEHSDLPALASVREAMEEALGLKFEGAKGEQFFRSTLVQTLFYGIFSAWVLWSKQHENERKQFEWRTAAWYLRVPMISALFQQLLMPAKLEPLGLVEVLDWAAMTLNRVADSRAFIEKFTEGHAVQYFYEPFLQEFDPELRKQLGVWYTPNEIVRYMVARVDTVLREELNVAEGLADENVYVLDPCCGTGAYLVEVLRRIEATLKERGEDALAGSQIKAAAMNRVFGFEILPAPFVVAHLQLGLLLQSLDAPLDATGAERVGVYLTNALTGWEPPREPKTRLLFPELEEERDRAEAIKQKTPILVVLGNPPYNGFAGIAINEERSLSSAYRTTQRAPAPQGQGLNDLYVRFFRVAERRIVEVTQAGVVCFISNYSWLNGLSFTGMRERYLEAFDRITIDSLNGDKYKTGKLTPEGKPDPSIFSTETNREGIQVGTAIATLVRRKDHTPTEAIEFRHLWGKEKRTELLATMEQDRATLYAQVPPVLHLGLPFMAMRSSDDYGQWLLLTELFPVSFPGVKTSRDDVVVDIDRARLIERMERYFDEDISHEEMRRIAPGAMENSARFQAEAVRDHLRKRGFLPNNIVRYCYRPFDFRWLYWEPETKLLDEKRTEYFPQVFEGNVCLAATQQNRKEFNAPIVTTSVSSLHTIERGANLFPLYLRKTPRQHLFDDHAADANGTRPNLSEAASDYLQHISAIGEAATLFYHTVATLHAPAYCAENAGALRQDFPRIPLPLTRPALEASATIGRQVAALLAYDAADSSSASQLQGVITMPLRPEMKVIGVVSRVGGGQLKPGDGELALDANWGFATKKGVMPGKGKVFARPYTDIERDAIAQGATSFGITADEAFALLGETTTDIYLNDVAYWRCVPARVGAITSAAIRSSRSGSATASARYSSATSPLPKRSKSPA